MFNVVTTKNNNYLLLINKLKIKYVKKIIYVAKGKGYKVSVPNKIVFIYQENNYNQT